MRHMALPPSTERRQKVIPKNLSIGDIGPIDTWIQIFEKFGQISPKVVRSTPGDSYEYISN